MVRSKMGLAAVVFVGLALVMAGCSLLQPTSSGGGESYFPHAQGNTWRHSSADGSSQVMTAEGSTSIGSTTVQIFSSTYISATGSVSTSEAYYRVDGSGVYAHGSSDYPSSIGLPFLSFPLEVGKTWDIVISGSYANKASVVAKESVTVPAGTFDCYKVNYFTLNGTIEIYNSNIWFGNNVGIVKANSSSSTIETILQWKSF